MSFYVVVFITKNSKVKYDKVGFFGKTLEKGKKKSMPLHTTHGIPYKMH